MTKYALIASRRRRGEQERVFATMGRSSGAKPPRTGFAGEKEETDEKTIYSG